MVNKAEVGRFDGELKVIAFNDGDTVQTLLDKANLSLDKGEGVNDDKGENVPTGEKAVNGETYYIVGNYKQGC